MYDGRPRRERSPQQSLIGTPSEPITTAATYNTHHGRKLRNARIDALDALKRKRAGSCDPALFVSG